MYDIQMTSKANNGTKLNTMYDIQMTSKANDGTKLNTVYLRHKPEDTDKIIRLRESMIQDGWTGRSVILIDAGDHHLALTGSHRLAAAQGLDDIEAVILNDLTAEEFDIIDEANDDDALLDAFRTILDLRKGESKEIIRQCIEVMEKEVMENERL